MLSLGYDFQLPVEDVVAIVAVDSAPIRRLIQQARDTGRLEDCTSGKKSRSAIITVRDEVYLSAFTADALSNRLYSAYLLTKVVNSDARWVSDDYHSRLGEKLSQPA